MNVAAIGASKWGDMGSTFGRLRDRLRFVRLLSSLCAIWCAAALHAHEVQPTIGDFSVSEGRLTLDLRLNLEAFMAGIDLDGLTDTNASELSGRYDALRTLSPSAIEDPARLFLQTWIAGIVVRADGLVVLSLEDITVPEVGDADLPRASLLVLTGNIPIEARSLTLFWPDGAGDLVLRQQGVEDPFTGYIRGGETSPEIALAGGAAQSGWQVFVSYLPVGFDHILPKGLDHILFVLGLFFLSARLRPLIWQVSAFTLAHTLTLAFGAMGWVNVSPGIVEPLIAASIVFVAVENLFSDGLNRWRPVVIFGFGLLHGLGFASVLDDYGLPTGQFFPALIGFNVGVELGQLTVIAIAFLSVGYWFRDKPWYRARISIPASLVIAAIGTYWFVERVI